MTMRGWEGSRVVRGRAGIEATQGQICMGSPLTQGRHQGRVMPEPVKESG